MPDAIYEVPTRQEVEFLFSTLVPLGAGSSVISTIREVDGFDAINFFGVSDGSFAIQVEEACSKDGPFVVTSSLASSPVGGIGQLCSFVLPCASFMRITVSNTRAPQTSLSICVQGVPRP